MNNIKTTRIYKCLSWYEWEIEYQTPVNGFLGKISAPYLTKQEAKNGKPPKNKKNVLSVWQKKGQKKRQKKRQNKNKKKWTKKNKKKLFNLPPKIQKLRQLNNN